MYTREYAEVFAGDERWRSLPVPAGDMFAWDPASTYVRRPPFFDGAGPEPGPLADIEGARVLALLGDSVTTDHISPAGAIKPDSPAGRYLTGHGVQPRDFNSYGSRRGNHEVMIRGTFANIRLRNQLAPGTEGGYTRHLPGGEQMTIYDAAQRYAADGVPLLVIAGKEYGSGSSRDWAAKGTALLGVRAVLAASFERIHRSNLIGMGVLPLQFAAGRGRRDRSASPERRPTPSAAWPARRQVPRTVTVTVAGPGGTREFTATVRIDTPAEAAYYRHGGILPYVLRQLLGPGRTSNSQPPAQDGGVMEKSFERCRDRDRGGGGGGCLRCRTAGLTWPSWTRCPTVAPAGCAAVTPRRCWWGRPRSSIAGAAWRAVASRGTCTSTGRS